MNKFVYEGKCRKTYVILDVRILLMEYIVVNIYDKNFFFNYYVPTLNVRVPVTGDVSQ